MGNKEGKFKKVFEEIDASGDGRVSLDELENFLGAKYLGFSPLVPSKRDKNILVLLSVYKHKEAFSTLVECLCKFHEFS